METDIGIVSGSIDILAALTLIFGIISSPNSVFIVYVAFVMIVKSIWRFFRVHIISDAAAWIDLFSGITLLLIYFGVSYWLFFIVGLLELLKGSFAFLSGIKFG